MIRVLLADDHPIILQGLRLFVDAQPGLRVTATAATADEVMAAVPGVDVAVLDLSLPGGGVDLIQRVSTAFPKVGVIVFSVYPEGALALHLLKSGARAYLSKDRSTEELVRAIRRVAAGGRYITERIEDLALERTGQSDDLPPHEQLSAREHQVFMAVLAGHGVSEISELLDVAPSTVSNHLARVKEKLGVTTVGQVVLYGHRVGLLG